MDTRTYKRQFLAAMHQDGIIPHFFDTAADIISDGKLHRFGDVGGKVGAKDCWYVMHRERPVAGAYGCWRLGIHKTWVPGISVDTSLLTGRMERIRHEVSLNFEKVPDEVYDVLRRAVPANGRHQYLINKKVEAHGIFYLDGALIIPLCNTAGQRRGAQRIFRNGRKTYVKGSIVTGHYHMIGTPQNSTICIAEGYATAATIQDVTSNAVAVAFSAGNLLPVAEELKAAYPDMRLIICADDDVWTSGNPGMTEAIRAGRIVGARVVWPRFADSRTNCTDFNDLFCEEGPEAVIKCFMEWVRNV